MDLAEAVCPQRVCRSSLGDELTFLDTNHLTASFARSLGEVVVDQVSGGPG